MASQNSSSVSAALLMGRSSRGLGSAPASTSFSVRPKPKPHITERSSSSWACREGGRASNAAAASAISVSPWPGRAGWSQ